jgi:molybdopterin-guanine dinucleotide biosynthesis protein A
MTGIILAGGKNTRIRTNKALLKIGDKTIIQVIVSKLKQVFDEIIVVTDRLEPINQLPITELTRIVNDIIPDKGSLGGLYSGLINSRSQYNFVVACDMPFLNVELIKFMKSNCNPAIACKSGVDVIIPKLKTGYETLHAIYSKNCIAPIEKQLRQDNLKIIDFFSRMKVKEITEDIIKQFDSQLLSFFNINTEDDYKQALNIAPSLRTYKDSL